jgi:hypothetical protein
VEKNKLYYGDNLEVLRQHVKDESVDLIYLDPPFNSRQDYSVLFAEKDGTRSSSQIMAFEDTWEWNVDAERAYEEIVERGGRVSEAMRAFGFSKNSGEALVDDPHHLREFLEILPAEVFDRVELLKVLVLQGVLRSSALLAVATPQFHHEIGLPPVYSRQHSVW